MSEQKIILAIGDDPEIQQLLAEITGALSVRLEKARDNQHCLELISQRQFDLIVTDPATPAHDDIEFLKRVRALKPNAKILVVVNESAPEAVIEAIRAHAYGYFSKPCDHDLIGEAVKRGLGLPDWRDGITVLSARTAWITLRVKCRMSTAERLVQFVRELEVALLPDERENIALAFREMLMNAIEHGARHDPEQSAEISYVRTSRLILYRIQDPGAGFSLSELPHAAVSNPLDDPTAHLRFRMERNLRAGGFGIMMVRNLVDELIYNEKGNDVLLIRYL